jgi:DNA replication and repair protein RecF
MFYFSHISLVQFRNYSFRELDFSNRIIAISGLNGSGKTNLLEVIYYMCFTKNYTSRTDAQNVQEGNAGFRISGLANINNTQHTITCILRENNRKEFLVDDEPYKKMSQHIGRFPAVMIAPDDAVIITESEERRRLTDTIISQLDSIYLQDIIAYNKILQQRNSLLKSVVQTGKIDEAVLEILDEQLAEKGDKIYRRRNIFFQEYIPELQLQYQLIAGNKDRITASYCSRLSEKNMLVLLRENRVRDMYLQRTDAGTHRDDVEFKLYEKPFKIIASQGQRKSLLFALKLAEYNILRRHKGITPVLLLDDVFEKLDELRINNLLRLVCNENNGQVFITDTHQQRFRNTFQGLKMDYQLIEL